ADLGADVVKIERPGAGDDTRGWGPPFARNDQGETTDAAYYLCANRNKRSVAVDMAAPDGAELIRRLARKADIVLENFKPGGLKKYGLDYDALRGINPRLVYCSITGFGYSGPYRERPGYDFIVQAMGGLMSATGEPKGEPMKAGVAVADLFAGMYAATSMLAALRHAERTGEGQHLDVALYDCQIAMLANLASGFLVSGESPARYGNAHASIVPYQAFAAADHEIVVAVGNDGQFARFCEVIGAPALAADERFKKNRGRVEHRAALIPMIAERLKQRPARDWLERLEAAGVPAGPVNTIDRVFADPQTIARGMTLMLERADEAPERYVPHPVKYSGTPVPTGEAPPKLGEHTDDVMRELLGLDDGAVKSLRAKGVIG
ncbi:MAG: CaiB/BaiF CoA-transferase family protein, partial [Parvularculaceae bacterium]